MKPRVDCINCRNFIEPEFEFTREILMGTTKNARCKLGKRVMFRMPKSPMDGDYGYIRYCEDYKSIEK